MYNPILEFIPFLIILLIVAITMFAMLRAELPAAPLMKTPPQLPKAERGTLTAEHTDSIGRHLIRHDDPEEGYVILNGVKRRIEDCKYL